jgi:8-oxo-dGTP diphosphatase
LSEARITPGPSPPPIHVVAAILRDAQGRILLAQRGPHGDFPGAWEFPGGKVEAHETPGEALRRELREELGIRIGRTSPLIAVPQRYPHKRIVLDVHRVEDFSGTPQGREGQALRWATPEELALLPMPPADRPVVATLQQPAFYLVTPAPGADDDVFLEQLERCFARVERAQLRLPAALPAARFSRLAREAARRAAARGVELLLNSGHAEAAALARTLDLGLHLRAVDLRAPPAAVAAVAASCHDAAELGRAQALGCRFVVLGPVRHTATHPGTMPLGWQGFAALRAEVSLPIYALGGLGRGDLAAARAQGAQGIAAIRALWPAPAEDPSPD